MIDKLQASKSGNFFLLAGPCVIEGEQMAMDIAGHVSEITKKLDIPYVFKGSYRKANRSRIDSFTGIGDVKALEILRKVRDTYGIPVVTDIHTNEEAALAAKYVDVLQIPAFLCRQTELLVAYAKTGKAVNIKKGQFLSPEAMQFAVQKVKDAGNNDVAITERGTTFGYQDLIVDFRGVPEMQKYAPVILDVTHSLQQPNQTAGVTGGLPHLIETMAKAGIATGVDGIFIETHQDPSVAKSDGANMLKLEKIEDLLTKLTDLRMVVKISNNMKEYIYSLEMQVRDYELDSEGIVNNANYLHYLEHTRHSFCSENGISFAEMQNRGIIPVLNKVEIEYKEPLRSGDVFDSKLWLERKGVRFVFHQDLFKKNGRQVVKAVVSCVCLENGRLDRGETLAEIFKNFLGK